MNKFLIMIICLNCSANLYSMKRFFTGHSDTKKNKSEVILPILPAGYLCVAPVSEIVTVNTTTFKDLKEKFKQLGFAGNEPLLLVMAYGLKCDRLAMSDYGFSSDKNNEWGDCCSKRFPYTMLSNKKEGDSIELEINDQSIQLQCKQLGSYYEQFAPGKRFEDILVEYRNKIEKDCLAKGSPEVSLPTIKTNVYLSNLTDAILAAGIFLVPLIKLGLTRD